LFAFFREETKSNIERKQARKPEEDDEVNADSGEESDSDDDDRPYNPLNLPLGWDGKPIPYWLYKLHGLGVEHKCEICGNYTYMGRKPFERHFTVSPPSQIFPPSPLSEPKLLVVSYLRNGDTPTALDVSVSRTLNTLPR